MKFKFMQAIVVGLMLFVCNIANATLITEVWSFKIKHSDDFSDGYLTKSANDEFSIRLIFDDESLITNKYYDDGTVESLCVGTLIDTVGCTASTNAFTSVSDMDFFGFDGLFDVTALESDGGYFYDASNLHYAQRKEFNGVDAASTSIFNDVLSFSFDDLSRIGLDASGTLSFKYKSTNGDSLNSTYSLALSNRFVETVNVPEPSTLAIFALSMVGLASRRLKNSSFPKR